MSEIFDAREKAFEAVFFSRVSAERIQSLQEQRKRKVQLAELAHAVGISDTKLLQKILDLGVKAPNLIAISLVPLVCVAWADGKLSREERKAALRAAREAGMMEDSESESLFESWLAEPPGPEFLEAWKDYMRTVVEQLDVDSREVLRRDLMRQTRKIAEASGGFLGLGNKIDPKEETVLQEIESVFTF